MPLFFIKFEFKHAHGGQSFYEFICFQEWNYWSFGKILKQRKTLKCKKWISYKKPTGIGGDKWMVQVSGEGDQMLALLMD